MPDEETQYQLLKILSEQPGVSQRQLAVTLGFSLGKVNYCLRALVDQNWIRAKNNYKDNNKQSYAYLLTPTGIQHKAEMALAFLQRKQQAYEQLKQEINQLQAEILSQKQMGLWPDDR